MQKLTFTKTGIVCSFLDQSSSKWIDRDISEAELPFTWYLPHVVVIDEGLTVREILSHLLKYEEQINFIFVSHLKGLSLSDLIKSIESVDKTSDIEKVDAVCLLWLGQVKPLENEEDPFLAIQPAMMALEMPDLLDEEEDELHSIHNISAKQLMDSPFVLDDLLEFIDPADPEEAEFSGLVNWEVFDFIGSLLNELVIYSFVTGSLSELAKIDLAPLSAEDLFDHLAELDKFFSTKDLGD